MRRRSAVGSTFAKFVKEVLEFRRARDDDASADRSTLEQCTEVIQVTVEERVFVVPFRLDGDTTFYVVHVMSRLLPHGRIDPDAGLETVRSPSKRLKGPINPHSDGRATATW